MFNPDLKYNCDLAVAGFGNRLSETATLAGLGGRCQFDLAWSINTTVVMVHLSLDPNLFRLSPNHIRSGKLR